jgi:hypothetical protein
MDSPSNDRPRRSVEDFDNSVEAYFEAAPSHPHLLFGAVEKGGWPFVLKCFGTAFGFYMIPVLLVILLIVNGNFEGGVMNQIGMSTTIASLVALAAYASWRIIGRAHLTMRGRRFTARMLILAAAATYATIQIF